MIAACSVCENELLSVDEINQSIDETETKFLDNTTIVFPLIIF